MSFYNLKQIVETKEPSQFPEYVTQHMKLLSLVNDPKSVKPYGSYNNRISEYPADIDLIEILEEPGNLDELAESTARRLKNVVRRINDSDDTTLSELKAGYDKEFLFDVGTLEEGVYYPDEHLVSNVHKLYNRGSLTKKEYDEIMKVLNKSQLDQNDYDDISDFFRNKLVLRWTANEVLDGYKTIRGNKYYLDDAVKDHTPIKLDLLVIDPSGKILEITNFVIVKNDKGEVLNQDPNSKDNSDLRDEIEKLYFSRQHYRPFKMVKRAFAYLKKLYNENPHQKIVNTLLRKYTAILESKIGILYAIYSELDAMILMLTRANRPNLEKIDFRLDQLKEPLANVLELSAGDLNNYINEFDEIINKKSAESKAEALEELQKKLGMIIDNFTIRYMIKLNINPPPSFILPKHRSYDRVPRSLQGGFVKDAFKYIYQSAANKYRALDPTGRSRPLHFGEFHLGRHNFTGPGTRIDLPEVYNQEPYNEIDACSKQHDLDYVEALKETDPVKKDALIRKADIDVIKCYDKYPNVSGYSIAKAGINNKMRLENALPVLSRSIFGDISGSGQNYTRVKTI